MSRTKRQKKRAKAKMRKFLNPMRRAIKEAVYTDETGAVCGFNVSIWGCHDGSVIVLEEGGRKHKHFKMPRGYGRDKSPPVRWPLGGSDCTVTPTRRDFLKSYHKFNPLAGVLHIQSDDGMTVTTELS